MVSSGSALFAVVEWCRVRTGPSPVAAAALPVGIRLRGVARTGRKLLCINSLSKSESFGRDLDKCAQDWNLSAGDRSLQEQVSPGTAPKSRETGAKSRRAPSRTLGHRRQLLVGRTRSETFSSPDRIRTFHRRVNSRLLTSGAVVSQRAD